jgi:subtilisin family serine protease
MRAQFRSVTLRLVAAAAVVVGPLGIAGAIPAQASPNRTYVVLYGGQTNQAQAVIGIARAGGTAAAAYGQIGVAIARSSSSVFASRMRQLAGVLSVVPTARYGRRLPDLGGLQDIGGPIETADDPGQPSDEVGGLAHLQWDMKQIHSPEAHQVTRGSHKVLVGIIDTGIDYTHPNLAPNLAFDNSVSCIGGAPNQSPSAWNDDNGHGTHVAGTVAATSQEDNLGIDGVAPGVRIAAIKAGDRDGDFFPEAVVCAFMWAGNHHFNVTNNSYFADPWLYNCLDDPGQRAIWDAEKRAIDFAIGNGVTVVAAAGNYNDNLAHPTIDPISPDFPPGSAIVRDVSEDCFTVPSMVPGVITVSSVGMLQLKAYYSSFGTGYIKVTAPGGDFRQLTAGAPNGRVLSSFPANPTIRPGTARVKDCTSDGVCATFAYLQGTSMASPHVAGLAALVISRFGQDGNGLSPGQVLAHLTSSADPLPCPPDPFNPATPSPKFPGFTYAAPPAHCEGTSAYNSFYGYGQINALTAVTQN